jgi:hypothetical protein
MYIFKDHSKYMFFRIICGFLVQFLVVAVLGQQRSNLLLNAERDWTKTKIPCGDLLFADTLGFLCYASGCEAKMAVCINRYKLTGDTIEIKPFDFLSEEVFLEIIKIPANGPVQTVEFYGAEGDEFKGSIDSSFMIQLIGGRKEKWINQTGSNILKISRNQFAGIAIQQLEKIFGVPVVFWIHKDYDYQIKINIPTRVLNDFIIMCGNLPDKYLLMEKGFIHFPGGHKNMKIETLRRY